MKKSIFLLVCIASMQLNSFAQTRLNMDTSAKMQWFKDAKLGIFIHWGIYSVNGVDESWSFYNKKISYENYMSQLKGFTASRYQPDKWVKLIKSSGARYAVITTKHHDGVALWDTKMNELSIPKQTPAKRDVLSPFITALRQSGLKVGTYFSLLDWSNPDYTGFIKDSGRYTISQDSARWNRFRHFCQGQIAEILAGQKPDLVWFDGDWEHSAEEWESPKIRKMILDANPNTIINGRLAGFGDYETPEQNFPISRPSMHPWELCLTSNKNWGYHPDDKEYKTPYELITIFADVISNGGNLLFDIGPREDGWIPDEQVKLLQELGKWSNKHAEAIFGTEAGIAPGHFYGPTTLSKDSSTLYLFLPSGATGNTVIKGLNNQIKKITVVGSRKELGYKVVGKISWSPVPGLVYIDHLSSSEKDKYMTVLAVELDGPVKLYAGKGGFGTE